MTRKQDSLLLASSKLAIVFLREDAKLLLILYPFLAFPDFLPLFVSANNYKASLGLVLVNRFIELCFICIVSLKWIKKLLDPQVKSRYSFHTLRFFIFGYCQWLLYAIPIRVMLALTATSDWNALEGLILVLLGVSGIMLALKYFFFFVPALLHTSETRFSNILSAISDFTRADKMLPIKVLIAPMAVALFLTSIPLAFSPDGRHIAALHLATFFQASLWALTAYFTLAVSFVYIDKDRWKEYGLKDTKESVLAKLTDSLTGPYYKLLLPSSGALLLIASFMLWISNMYRLQHLPPAAKITVNNITLSTNIITLDLTLEDDKFKFSGFIPAAMHLAGETGKIISPIPFEIIEPETNTKYWLVIPPSKGRSIHLIAKFKTSWKVKKLKQLRDLYLYYRNLKVIQLDMEKAVINRQNLSESQKN